MSNPFSGPFGGPGGLEDPDEQPITRPCCPKCKSENFRSWTNQYGLMRKCLEPSCQNEWSGGTMASGRNNFGDLFPQPIKGVPVPDEDFPVVQYTGAGFRDPMKTFGDDDY